MPDKRFRQFDVLNESRDRYSHEGDQLVVETSTGSMWGKGNTCKNLFLYPKPVSLFEAHVLTTILPQANGEQAGLVFYQEEDNYVKFIREMVADKQVVVIAKEIDGARWPDVQNHC